MNKLYTVGNYIIAIIGANTFEYARSKSIYTKEGNSYEIREALDNGVLNIAISDIGNWYDESGTIAFTESTLVEFLRSNTGVQNNPSPADIASGKAPGVTHTNKFGKELIIASGINNVDIVGNGNGVYVPPTANRVHQVKSDNAADVGTLRGTYGSTTFNQTKLIDTGATFIADGVAIGDTVVNDTNQDHSKVLSVDSETQLTVEHWHHSLLTNVGDTFRIAGAGGTGAVFVHIKDGEKKDGTKHTEFILLNGITNVPTLNSYFRITRSHIHGAGANKVNVGVITMIADVDTTTTIFIGPNRGQTLMAFIHVPEGKYMLMNNCYTTMFRASKVADAAADMQLMSNLWGDDSQNVEHSLSAGNSHKFNPPKKFTQGTDVWWRSIQTTDTNSTISAGFDVEFYDN